MIPTYRQQYNAAFTEEKFEAVAKDIDAIRKKIPFRLAETPMFIPKGFYNQIHSACESIIDVIVQPNFKELTESAIPKGLRVPNENGYPHCIAFDFGICKNETGDLEPQLIEMQAFPTLFGYQVFLDDIFQKHFELPQKCSPYLGGLDRDGYIEKFKKLLLDDCDPENVILLEIFPHQQKTNIDFYSTEDLTGVKPVCVTELIKKGNQLFYINNGKETLIKRIYNRIIFDELLQQEQSIQDKAAILFEELDVTWVPHPNWFYRISKFTLPLINHPNIPETHYLNTIKEIPTDLENYVLKPLFSFAGQGVVIDVTHEHILAVKDPENWILQRKVNYAAVIETLDEPAKAEIRIFYFWDKNAPRPTPTNNLSRLSKGKMIGVRYNKDKIWTGGSYCLFEK